jgi:RHS repeat-associated protein
MTCRIEDGVAFKHTYNTENRISSIMKLASGTCTDQNPVLATKWDFAYDGDGVRTSTLTTPYDASGAPQTATLTSYFFGGAYEVRSDNTTIKYYSFAGQTIMNDGSGLKYLLTDHLGSVVAITDDQGDLISQHRYLPFGGTRELPNQPASGLTDYGYTGQRDLDDGLGLMDYKFRFYSPYLNRFIQPDSIVPDTTNPQAYNRFSYVHNRPIVMNDPTGHVPIDCIGSNYCGSAKDPEYVLDSQFKPKPLKPKPPKQEDIPQCGYHHCGETIDVVDAYELGWQNFGQAWNIWTNPNANYWQRFGAGAYMGYWGGAHVMFVAGAAGLICAGFVTCASALGFGGTTTNTACGGDMCASEITVAQTQVTTVIGRFPANRNLAQQIGGNYLNVQGDVWRQLEQAGKAWERNQQWLQEAMIRGDVFRLASPLKDALPGTGYYKELEYLFRAGYTITVNQQYLLPPIR